MKLMHRMAIAVVLTSMGVRAQTAPVITSVSPAAPRVSASAQDFILNLTGTKDGDKLRVKLTDPGGARKFDQEATAASGALKIDPKFDTPGKWQATASGPSGSSAPYGFEVAPAETQAARAPQESVCRAVKDSPEVIAFNELAWNVKWTFWGLLVVLVVTLSIATVRGNWSLAAALSEESSSQPKDILDKKSVILVPSASRLIAVGGMVVIIALILEMGSAIAWNLFVCGKAPDLTGIRGFIIAMSGIFVPYIANQVRAMVTSGKPAVPEPAPRPAAPAIAITGIAPSVPQVTSVDQPLTFYGAGFQHALTLTLSGPGSRRIVVPGTRITDEGPTYFKVPVALTSGGNWTAAVTNPGGTASAAFAFRVETPTPAITSLNPASFANAQTSQAVTINGLNFMPDAEATISDPAGASRTIAISRVSDTEARLDAVFSAAGAWTVVVKNPGGTPSAPQILTVT